MVVRVPMGEERTEQRVPRTPWLIGAAALLVVAVGAVVLLRVEPDEPVAEPPRPREVIKPVGGLPPMPAQPVNAAGDLAKVVSDPVLSPGQYLYVRIVTKKRVWGQSETESVGELWWPGEVGKPMMMRNTEAGQEPAVSHGARQERHDAGRLESTPAAVYAEMRARLGTAVDAPEQARDELLAPLLTDPFITEPERDLRLTTLGYVPRVDLRTDQRLADGTLATLIRGVTYGDEARVDCYFDAETGHLREARWRITLTEQSAGRSQDVTITSIRPVVVPSIGAVP